MIPSNSNGGGGESMNAGLHDSLLDSAEAESLLPTPLRAVRSRWSKVNVSLRFVHTLRPLSSSAPPYIAARSRWSKVNVSLRFVHTLSRPLSSSAPPDNHDVRINIPDDEESVIPHADTTDAAGTSHTNAPSRSRSTVKRIMNSEDLNLLIDRGSDQFVASAFNSNLESGLQQAAVATIMNPAESDHRCAKSLASYFIDEIKSWDIVLLVIAGVLSLALGMLDVGPHSGWHDSVAIFLAILLLITVPSLSKFREARKLEKKMHKEKEEKKVEVIRGGLTQEIADSSVVEGDLVILVKGIRVPGDGLLVGGSDRELEFDDRPNKPFLRYGSKVVAGTGRMIVTSVGCDTKMGELMSKVNCDRNVPTCLQCWILGPMSYMDKLSLSISILVIIGIFIHFRHKIHDKSLPEMKGKPPLENLMSFFMRSLYRPRGLALTLVTSLSTLAMVYQQGVPLTISLALSYWNEKVKSLRNDDGHVVHPQNLSACATMGFVNVICFDISGEIVLQTMEIGKFFVGDKEFSLGEESYDTFRHLLQRDDISINICKDLRSPIDSLIEPLLQPMMGTNEEFRVNKSFADKLSKSNSGKEVLLIKHGQDIFHWRGPAQRILDRCSSYSKLDGTTVQMSPNQRIQFEALIASMKRDGFYPIALAYKKTKDQELKQCDLILLAVFGVKFKNEAVFTLEALVKDGVIVKIISEDSFDEVKSLLDQPLNSGLKFILIEDKLFPEENVRTEIMVMGKLTAPDKLQMVQRLKQEGHIVAFSGGGGQRYLDAPSVREADVGLIIEPSTEVIKEVTDIVLTGGRCFLPIYSSLFSFGRCISNNLKKFTELQFTVTVSALIINSVSSLASGDSTMTTIQVVWANTVICILGGLMMIIRFPNCEMNEVSDRCPGSRTSLLTQGMWVNLVIQVLYQVSVIMFFLFEKHFTKLLGINQDVKNTFVFNSFILCQVVNVLNTIQLDEKEVFLITMNCYTFSASLVAILVVQFLQVQFLSLLLNFHKLNCVQWVECFVVALFPWVCRLTLESLSNYGRIPWIRSLTLESLSIYGAWFDSSFRWCYTELIRRIPWIRSLTLESLSNYGALFVTSFLCCYSELIRRITYLYRQTRRRD